MELDTSFSKDKLSLPRQIHLFQGGAHVLDGHVSLVETEYREMLFQVETEHSDKELYRIIAQSRPVQMISY